MLAEVVFKTELFHDLVPLSGMDMIRKPKSQRNLERKKQKTD